MTDREHAYSYPVNLNVRTTAPIEEPGVVRHVEMGSVGQIKQQGELDGHPAYLVDYGQDGEVWTLESELLAATAADALIALAKTRPFDQGAHTRKDLMDRDQLLTLLLADIAREPLGLDLVLVNLVLLNATALDEAQRAAWIMQSVNVTKNSHTVFRINEENLRRQIDLAKAITQAAKVVEAAKATAAGCVPRELAEQAIAAAVSAMSATWPAPEDMYGPAEAAACRAGVAVLEGKEAQNGGTQAVGS